ncbi:MAG: efflux RND transporter periplasmic adaptor subunit [Bacteroidetes bacterium]|nr:efflux RND transporter periplasmic adaptor subunit [Bacteroidota bacterium]
MKIMSKKYWISRMTIGIVFSILIISCTHKPDEQTQTSEHHQEEENTVEFTESQYKTAAIELGKIENKQISGTIKVNGQLDVPPQQKVSVSAPLGGFLKNTPLLQGTRVKKGQVIATIENIEFVQLQQDYLEARNQLEFAEKDYERQQDLAKENVAAQKVLQQAKTTFVSWQSKVIGLKEKLKVLNISVDRLSQGEVSSEINLYSPINGYVTEVNVNIGKFVNPADILFEIVDTEHLHAELTVFEKDVPKLKIGQKVRFTLANETKERLATVYLLGREISKDRTIRIHCHIDNEDTNLLPGMYLKAIVETGGIEVPALPDRAVIDFQGKKYIFYQLAAQPHAALKDESQVEHENEYHFIMMEVQTGNSEMGFTEVILPENFPSETAQIAVKNAYAILSKMKNSEEEE